MQKILVALSLSILFVSCNKESSTQNKNSESNEFIAEKAPQTEAEKIAYANGYEHWDNVTQLNFTFNVDNNGQTVAQRSWSWRPKDNMVTMISAGDTITYNRTSIDSIHIKADRGFINDKYWLLAPYQIVSDSGTQIEVTDNVESPLSRKQSKKLTLLYGNEGGYTPGDAYDFYYGDDYLITEWVFRKGNSPEPSMTTTFEGYEDFKGLNIATDHKSEDGNFRLYFTDITVEK